MKQQIIHVADVSSCSNSKKVERIIKLYPDLKPIDLNLLCQYGMQTGSRVYGGSDSHLSDYDFIVPEATTLPSKIQENIVRLVVSLDENLGNMDEFFEQYITEMTVYYGYTHDGLLINIIKLNDVLFNCWERATEIMIKLNDMFPELTTASKWRRVRLFHTLLYINEFRQPEYTSREGSYRLDTLVCGHCGRPLSPTSKSVLREFAHTAICEDCARIPQIKLDIKKMEEAKRSSHNQIMRMIGYLQDILATR